MCEIFYIRIEILSRIMNKNNTYLHKNIHNITSVYKHFNIYKSKLLVRVITFFYLSEEEKNLLIDDKSNKSPGLILVESISVT